MSGETQEQPTVASTFVDIFGRPLNVLDPVMVIHSNYISPGVVVNFRTVERRNSNILHYVDIIELYAYYGYDRNEPFLIRKNALDKKWGLPSATLKTLNASQSWGYGGRPEPTGPYTVYKAMKYEGNDEKLQNLFIQLLKKGEKRKWYTREQLLERVPRPVNNSVQ